jgi:hypothetical protein
MLFRSSFAIPKWDEEAKRKVVSFWTERGVRFGEISDRRLVGNRGSILGNMTSFDMAELRTKVIIQVSESDECECVLDVNTAFQIITEWNRQHWELELQTFESYIVRGDERQDDWRAYETMAKKANVTVIVAAVICTAVIVILILLPVFSKLRERHRTVRPVETRGTQLPQKKHTLSIIAIETQLV